MARSKMKAIKKQVKKQEIDPDTLDRLNYLGNLDEEDEQATSSKNKK